MATQKNTKCHAANFVQSLSANQRNALRIILASEGCLGKLRRALGTQLTETISEDQRKTGLAKLGRTVDLFPEHDRRAVNLHALDRHTG
jgi:hypothetical protein